MKVSNLGVLCSALLLLVSALSSCASGSEANGQEQERLDEPAATTIVGSYELVSRRLSNGSTLEPPEIFGFMTFTRDRRHFHLYEPTADGRHSSISYRSSYEFADGQYTETSRQVIATGRDDRSAFTYDVLDSVTQVPVTVGEGTLEFQDGENGPTLVFSEALLSATREGEFTDYWARLD